MKILAYLLALVASQALPPFAFSWISRASYDEASISTATEDGLTMGTLSLAAFGLVLGGRGVYLTVVRLRPWLAGVVTTLLWTPLVLSAAVYCYALLVFRSLA